MPTPPSASILSPVNGSWAEVICKLCAAIIQAARGIRIRRLFGSGDLWITEYTIVYLGRPSYTVSIMEFKNGNVVHETQYFADPFDPPARRTQWVEHGRH